MTVGRCLVLVAATALVLAVPAPASAHSRSPTIALDVRLRVESRPGVDVDVVDGNRALRLSVTPPTTLIVRGLLGEPFLRFSRDGVWANLASPTTAADRLAPAQSGRGWTQLTSGRGYTWHDHRLAAPRGQPPGSTAPFALPVFLNGSPETIVGTFAYVARPAWWPWLLAAAAGLGAVVAVARLVPSRRRELAWATAAVAAVSALVACLGFATGRSLAVSSLWMEVAVCAGLVVVAAAAAVIGKVRTWVASLVGAAAVVVCLPKVVVFWHGVILSSLSPGATRAAVAGALAAGLAAAGVSFGADDPPARRQRASLRSER